MHHHRSIEDAKLSYASSDPKTEVHRAIVALVEQVTTEGSGAVNGTGPSDAL
jgi:hypothetical protein